MLYFWTSSSRKPRLSQMCPAYKCLGKLILLFQHSDIAQVERLFLVCTLLLGMASLRYKNWHINPSDATPNTGWKQALVSETRQVTTYFQNTPHSEVTHTSISSFVHFSRFSLCQISPQSAEKHSTMNEHTSCCCAHNTCKQSDIQLTNAAPEKYFYTNYRWTIYLSLVPSLSMSYWDQNASWRLVWDGTKFRRPAPEVGPCNKCFNNNGPAPLKKAHKIQKRVFSDLVFAFFWSSKP